MEAAFLAQDLTEAVNVPSVGVADFGVLTGAVMSASNFTRDCGQEAPIHEDVAFSTRLLATWLLPERVIQETVGMTKTKFAPSFII